MLFKIPQLAVHVAGAFAENCIISFTTTVGFTGTIANATSFPVNATVCGLFVAESVNVSVAVRVPDAAGVNVTLTVQFPDPAKVVPQVFAEIAKSPALVPEMAMLVMLIDAVPPFVNVTVWGELVAPTGVFANERLVGITDAFAVLLVPVPVNATVCGLFVAESVKVSVAVRVPAAVGVNVTLTVQLPEPAKVVPQVFAEMAKSPALAPEMAMLVMLIDAVPALARVTDCGELVELTLVAAKVRLAGVTDAFAVLLVPVPVNATVCGLFVAESVKVSVAVRVPAAAGVNVTLTVQLPEPARVAPQVFDEMAKSPALVPEMAMLVILIDAVPPLANVTVCGELVELTLVAANVRLEGVTDAFAALLVPVPDNATVCGLFPAESVKVSVAVRVPAAAGVNVALTVQVPEPARVVPQVFAEIAKSPALVPEMAMLVILMEAVPALARVTDCGELVELTLVAAKVRLEGVTDAFAVLLVPVPDNATVCGLFPAESVKVSVAVRVPAAVGVNVTLTVQFPEPARAVPQVFAEMAKSPALAPERAMLAILIEAVPPLANVTDCGEVVAPTAVFAKERLAGITLAFPELPVPVSDTVCGLLVALSVMATVALRVPAAEGVNTTLMVQVPEPWSVVPQVFEEIAKSPAFIPVRAALVMESGAVPWFCKVIVCAGLLVPTLKAPNWSELGFATAEPIEVVPTPERGTAIGEL